MGEDLLLPEDILQCFDLSGDKVDMFTSIIGIGENGDDNNVIYMKKINNPQIDNILYVRRSLNQIEFKYSFRLKNIGHTSSRIFTWSNGKWNMQKLKMNKIR